VWELIAATVFTHAYYQQQLAAQSTHANGILYAIIDLSPQLRLR
jgi:hypothetical protein